MLIFGKFDKLPLSKLNKYIKMNFFQTKYRNPVQHIIEYSDYPELLSLRRTNKMLQGVLKADPAILERKRCEYLLDLLDKDFSMEYLNDKLSASGMLYDFDYNDNPKLYFAILDKRYNTVNCMLPKIEWNNKTLAKALSIAAREGDLRMFEELRTVSKLTDEWYESIMPWAFLGDNTKIMDIIIDNAKFHPISLQHYLISAARMGDTRLVEYFLTKTHPNGSDALFEAVLNERPETVRLLLDDPRTTSEDIAKAAVYAIDYDYTDILKTLMADPRFDAYTTLRTAREFEEDTSAYFVYSVFNTPGIHDKLTPEQKTEFEDYLKDQSAEFSEEEEEEEGDTGSD